MVESKFVSSDSSTSQRNYRGEKLSDTNTEKDVIQGTNKPQPGLLNEQDKTRLKRSLKQMYFPGKRIFNTSLFIIGLAFVANATLLYVDTLTSVLHADIFFGFSRQGRNDHLQRSAAILGFIVGFMNVYTASIEKNKMLTGFTLFTDAISISHYIIETFYYKSIRYEYTALVTVFLMFNFIWGVRNYYYELRLVQEENINARNETREEMDASVSVPQSVAVFHED